MCLLFSKGTWWEKLLGGIIQKTVYLAKDSFVYDSIKSKLNKNMSE